MRHRFWPAVLLLLLSWFAGSPEVLAQEASCDPLAIDLALTPQRTPNYPNLKETLRVQADLPEAADVVMLGDSLLAGWRTDLPATFPSTAIYDFAVGGDRVPNVLWRLENIDLSHLKPVAAVLLIGTNDLAAGTPACAVAIGIRTIVERLRGLWPQTHVLVLTIPPRGADFHILDDPRQEVNRAIAALDSPAGRVHAVAIDDDAFTCGQYGKASPGQTTEGKGLSCDNYADDNLHFSTRGYVQLGHILQTAAARALGRDLFR